MTELVLRRVEALPVEECITRYVNGVACVTWAFHEAMVEDLKEIHLADLAWAQKVGKEHGIDLDALADADPEYRAEFRR